MTSSSNRARLALTMPRLSRYGGAESFAWRLSEALAARGHTVDFICARCETDPPAGVTPVVVGRFGGTRFIKTLWFTLMADRRQKQGDYALVFGMANTLNQDILRIGGGPISVFWQLSKLAWEEGAPRTFKMFRRRLSPVNWLMHWIDDIRMRRTPCIVAVSHFVRDLIVRAHPHLKPSDIEVIYNRPDLSRFSMPTAEDRLALRRAEGIPDDAVVIGTAATNFALKGIRYLIEALARLPENHVLHVAGGRNPEKYLRQAESLGVAHRVRFFGKVEDMPSFYHRTDVFILASFYDACSNAVLEALACGCRVVSSELNGSAYFLPEKWVFSDPGDVAQLAEVLLRVAGEDRPAPFSWPDDVVSGLEPYIRMIETMLAKK